MTGNEERTSSAGEQGTLPTGEGSSPVCLTSGPCNERVKGGGQRHTCSPWQFPSVADGLAT